MMKNYYLTYNEFNSGVYKSQIIDTLNTYNLLGRDFILIALLPLRGYFKNRKWIKSHYPNSKIFPALPTLRLLFLNVLYIFFLKSNSNVICRGSIATNLALYRKDKFRKIIYDARAAIAEEHKEYGNGKKYKRLIEIERLAVFNADYRLCVSEALVRYWNEKFQYKGAEHTVIPCCANECKSENDTPKSSFFEKVVMVFSGSTHPWQSFSLNCNFIEKSLLKYNNVNVLFLSKKNPEIDMLISRYGNSRVKCLWVKEYEVPEYLSKCDYGILLRDDNITNNVSAPVKFGEYLINGLDVIISPSVRDYSFFVKENSCGYVWSLGDSIPPLTKNMRRNRNKSLAKKYFTRGGDVNADKINGVLSLL